MQKGLLIFLILVLHLFCACKKSTATAINPLPVATRLVPTQSPTPDPIIERGPLNVVKEWKTFIKDGRYKLVQRDYNQEKPFHYSWSSALLVIVEDTQQKDSSRLKLVYFGNDKGGNGTFKPNWVMHNLDLSKCSISNASSDLVITENDKSKKRSAFLEWDKIRKRYTCLAR